MVTLTKKQKHDLNDDDIFLDTVGIRQKLQPYLQFTISVGYSFDIEGKEEKISKVERVALTKQISSRPVWCPNFIRTGQTLSIKWRLVYKNVINIFSFHFFYFPYMSLKIYQLIKEDNHTATALIGFDTSSKLSVIFPSVSNSIATIPLLLHCHFIIRTSRPVKKEREITHSMSVPFCIPFTPYTVLTPFFHQSKLLARHVVQSHSCMYTWDQGHHTS